MPYVSKRSKRRILLFLSAAACAALLNLLPQNSLPVKYTSSCLYGALLVAWGVTVRERVLQRHIRRYLLGGAALLLLLFVLRVCRYELANQFPALGRFLWYAYYIPFTAIPLCSLCAALCVGKPETEKTSRRVEWLWAVCALLAAAVLTNDLHGAVFHIWGQAPSGASYAYGPVYYVAVAWCAALSCAAFAVLTRRCRVSRSRRLWYVPAFPAFLGAALLLWYFSAGGSPVLGGVKLYNLHEAYALLFVGLWEGCIQIGLIPANSDYGELFALSHLNAALLDKNGRAVIRAAGYEPDGEGADCARRSHAITGGEIVWIEDLSAIRRLNEGLADATETLEAENDLIEQENLIQAEKTRYHEQNRLYDKISDIIRPQLDVIEAALRDGADDEAAFRERLAYASVLGAYVKRRANLELLADRAEAISSKELYYAISESFEYLRKPEIYCEARIKAETGLPAPLLSLAYELFEAAVEATYGSCFTYAATLDAAPGAFLTLALDTDGIPLDEGRWHEALAAFGAALTVMREDDTVYIRLAAIEEAAV